MDKKKNEMTKLWLRKEEWEAVNKSIKEKIETCGMITGKVLRNTSSDFLAFSPYVYWISKNSFRVIQEERLFPDGGEGVLVEIDTPFGILDDKRIETGNNDIEKVNEDLKRDESPWLVKTYFDPVSKPSHYTEGRKYEPRKVIYDWGLDFNLGNAVKYISRAGRKNDAIEDLKKAIQYIEFELEELENEKE